jgi:SAM-dependent methyltransferase
MRREASATERILRAHLREMPFHRVLIRTIEARFLSEVALPRPILDIGSGDGHFGSVIFPEGADVGLDRSVADLALARRRRVYGLLVGSDSGAMPFSDGRFGSAVSNCVFEHIPDIERTIGEIARVLRPGGTFACTVIGDRFSELLTDARVWSRLGLGSVRRAYLDWYNRNAAHFHFDSPETWSERFRRAGFSVERWRYYLSPEATRVMHRDHYLSVPHLVARKLTGRWVPFPFLTDNAFWVRRYRRMADEPVPEVGSCIAFVCMKRANPPVE